MNGRSEKRLWDKWKIQRTAGKKTSRCHLASTSLLLKVSAPLPSKKKEATFVTSFKAYPGWELNPHSRCGEQDFKSCVSTSSTTRVKKNHLPEADGLFRAEDRARTGHPDLGKVVLYQMSYFRILKQLLQQKRTFFVFGIAKISIDFTIPNFLFVFRTILSTFRSTYFRLAFITMGIHTQTSPQNEGNHEKYLTIKQESGRRNPIGSKILVTLINECFLHRVKFYDCKNRGCAEIKIICYLQFQKISSGALRNDAK